MKKYLNRREWLRNTAILSGGLSLMPSLINSANANTISNRSGKFFFDDREFAADNDMVLPNLRARLLANENPFGPSAAAKKAIADAINDGCRYPINSVTELEKKILDAEGLQEGQVMFSAGSSPLLRGAAIYYSKPGSNIVTANPTYDDIPLHCEKFGATIKAIPVNAAYEYDLDAMEKAIDDKTSLVYICNPNNPTGTVLNADKLRAFCERVSRKTLVFIDEAYIDYTDDPQTTSMIDLVKKGMNIIIARTFSKLYGFAGLRIGYIMSQAEIIKPFEDYSASFWAMSGPSIAGALATYREQPYMSDTLKKTIESKNYLYKVLKDEGYDYVPSHTNFVLFPIKMEGQRFVEEMMKRGVGVRFWEFNNKHYCRVSIGRMDEMQAFAEAFKEIS